MLVSLIGKRVATGVDAFDPFGEVYGVGRSILALGTALTIALGPLDDFRSFAVAALLLVASGWQPRFTGFVHAGTAFLLQVHHVEGGRIASLLALLLLPVAVLDDRRWHWTAPKPRTLDARERIRRLVGRAALLLLRVQVAVIYLHASYAQLQAGPVPMSVLVGEWLLGAGLFLGPRYRSLLLALGVTFHIGLALTHGGIALATMMVGALVLYLRPLDRPFSAVVRPSRVLDVATIR